MLTEDEITQLQRRRASKLRKRLRAAGEDDSLTTADKHQLTIEDQHRRHEPVRLPAKPSSLDTVCSTAGALQVQLCYCVLYSYTDDALRLENWLRLMFSRKYKNCTLHFHGITEKVIMTATYRSS